MVSSIQRSGSGAVISKLPLVLHRIHTLEVWSADFAEVLNGIVIDLCEFDRAVVPDDLKHVALFELKFLADVRRYHDRAALSDDYRVLLMFGCHIGSIASPCNVTAPAYASAFSSSNASCSARTASCTFDASMMHVSRISLV